MANFQGNRINPTRFSRGQIKFHVVALPLSIFMILPVIFMINNAFKPLGELFRFPPTLFVQNPTLDNFKKLFSLSGATGIPMSRYFLNSFIVAFLTVVLGIIITIMACLLYTSRQYLIRSGQTMVSLSQQQVIHSL